MTLDVSTNYGQIEVSNEVIATVAGVAAMDCYGLVGMASQSQLKDGITELLGRENWSKGIEVKNDNNEMEIDMYIIVGYGTKISEVAHNVQSKVKYTLDQMVGLTVSRVNIFVQGVRLVSEE
ncbi:Asp23/Gls24 family envelope stress response protein [Paludifilum halophilum]|uniref:Asp23/Gls24 family envelope stress response protein n=1 Tax=Paludifilum halophilum TaxID=1642702 RepID=A0A235B389_9BACL|nr:Asp23/Gls24 family envelope stress response protein [Paludifilum halophilum]OYD06429.1 Asp23/Gls24 family envelope stress response protein [Paludifilum halophilum]